MPFLILSAVLVGVDQLVKYLVRANIPLGESVPFLPQVMDLTYVQNTGAAFSLFQEHTWALAVISLAASIALAAVLIKRIFRHPFVQAALAVVLAGAVGNLIDRAFFGFVTDMFQTLFIHFAIFNVADICVVAGTLSLFGYVLIFYDRPEKKEKPDDAADADR